MEDPATWTPVQRLIDEAIRMYGEQDPEICGFSLATLIYNALYNAGCLAGSEPDGCF